MRKLLFLGLSVIYALVMTFCSYAPLVSQYITDEEHYIEIEVKVSDAKFNEEGYSYLYINLLEFDRYRGFTGETPDELDDELLNSTVIEIKIVPQNAALLNERGFFDNVKAEDVITVYTTCWIHDNIPRHYLASVTLGEEVYLSFEEGLDGIERATLEIKDIEIDAIFDNANK